MADKKTTQKEDSQTVRVRYEETQVLYAGQFLVNASAEEVVINFSSGFISDPQTGENMMPIHSRVALSPAGALRLMNTLSQAVQNMQAQEAAQDKSVSKSKVSGQEAGLPKIKK